MLITNSAHTLSMSARAILCLNVQKISMQVRLIKNKQKDMTKK